jgi:hypothetical protein
VPVAQLICIANVCIAIIFAFSRLGVVIVVFSYVSIGNVVVVEIVLAVFMIIFMI